MSNGAMSTPEDHVLARARAHARETLAGSRTFPTLPPEEQRAMYRDIVRSFSEELSRPAGMAEAMVQPASQLIDDKRHLNQRIDQVGDIAADFVQAVNFPAFVKDLLKGVFDANLAVTLQQMEAYGNLLKTATASLSKFVTAVDSAASFAYLAENSSDEFSIDFSDEDEDKTDDNPEGMVLVDKEGNKVASSRSDAEIDAAVKAKIMDAKIAMAQEHRALLRETLLMGVTRLVVEKGNVKAGVVFDFKATEKIGKKDNAATKSSRSAGGSMSASGGLVGSIFGGPRGGHSWSTQEATITVSSAKSQADTSLAAKLTGSVDITFKADFFSLDNFAAMYGPINREAAPVTPAAPGAPSAPPVPQAPAAPVAAR